MIRVVVAMVCLICASSTCGPVRTKFNLFSLDGSRVIGNSITDNNQSNVKLIISAKDAHYKDGNIITIFTKIKNDEKDTLFFKGSPFTLRTENFDVFPIIDTSILKPKFLLSNDSVMLSWNFGNRFKGEYKKFLNVYLSKAHIYIHPINIVRNGEELTFSEYELVYEH